MKTTYFKLTSRLAGTAAALAIACSASAQGQSYYYIYNGTQVPLTVVSGKFAMRSTVTDTAQAQRSLAAVASVNTSDTQSLGIPGWSVVNVAASQSGALRSLATAQTTATSAVATLASSSGVAFAAPVFTASGSETIPTQEILIGLSQGATINSVLASVNNRSITGSALVAGSTYKLTTNLTNGLDVLTLANSLNGKPGIAFAEPNFIQTGKSHLIPSDPMFSQAWGLRNTGQNGGRSGFDISATSAWDTTTGSSSVVVVVFECGIDPSHPDINATTGRDFTSSPVANAGPRSTGNEGADNHGTWVAGCISGKANNGLGATGVAPGVRIASARIGIPTGGLSFSSSTDWIVSALDWARSIGARVTNHSYTMGVSSSAIDAALQRARDAGIVNVAATGNDSRSSIGYPASSPYCLGVGAADRNGSKASFSNYGTGTDFLAPGVDIITTDRVGTIGGSTGDYATVSGTSFASPYAAGVAALVVSRNPTWSASQVETQLKNSCTDMGATGYDTTNGYGLINAFRALGGSTTPTDDVGNTTTAARAVSVPSSTSAAINYAGDIDMFRISIASRLELTVGSTGSTDTYGLLYDANGIKIAENDNANGSSNFNIVRVLTGGTYYVGVRHYSSTATSGSYVLSLSSRAPQEPEIRLRGNGYEIVKGDTTPSSTDHTSFGSTSGSIDRTFTIDNTGVANLQLTGSPLVSITSSGASPFSVTANPASPISAARSTTFTVRFRPITSGTFNATITIANNDYDEGSYTFAISGTGLSTIPADDHGNSMSTATTLLYYGAYAGNLERGGDVDYFKFKLGSSTTVNLSTSGNTDTFGYLYNSAGSLITSDDDGNGYPNFRISRTLSAGTYYLKVTGYSTTITGTYTMTIAR